MYAEGPARKGRRVVVGLTVKGHVSRGWRCPGSVPRTHLSEPKRPLILLWRAYCVKKGIQRNSNVGRLKSNYRWETTLIEVDYLGSMRVVMAFLDLTRPGKAFRMLGTHSLAREAFVFHILLFLSYFESQILKLCIPLHNAD